MANLSSLENVNALALPAKVLVLLSKYAQALRAHNGTILKLSSLRIFKHIHTTCLNANTPKLKYVYKQLLDEVNLHIEACTMYTNDAKKIMLQQQKKQTLNKLSKSLSYTAAIAAKNEVNTSPSADF